MRQQTHHTTIGILINNTTHPADLALWAGATQAALEYGADLICFPGLPLGGYPLEFGAQANVLYDLAGDQNVDGLIIWLAALSHHADPQKVRAFAQRYRQLPVVIVWHDGGKHPRRDS